MSCPWCIDGKCRTNDEENCDFKNLPMDKESIKHRIDEEFQICGDLLKMIKREENEENLRKYMAVMYDKLIGIKIMREMLQSKFAVAYFPKGRIEFTRMILEANKKMKKLGVRNDENGKKEA
jgi:two-component sensor histidine kinase